MTKKKHKKQKSNLLVWLEFIPFWFLYKVIRAIPLKVAYAISGGLFKLLYRLDGKHRNRAVKHILHAGMAANVGEARLTAHKAFRSFSKLLVEIFKMDQMLSPDKVKFSGNAASIRAITREDGKKINVIVVTGHYGNWELAGSAWAQKTGIPMVSVMRPFSNPLIGKFILRNRESDIHQCVNKEGGIKGMLRALKDGKHVAILADQHAGHKEGVETVFFGQPCRTHASPALLHLKTGIPILPEMTRRIDDDFNFEFVVGELIEYKPTGDKEKDIQAVTQMYTTALEQIIRQEPEQWMWAHRRWLNIHRKGNKNCVAAVS